MKGSIVQAIVNDAGNEAGKVLDFTVQNIQKKSLTTIENTTQATVNKFVKGKEKGVQDNQKKSGNGITIGG